MEQVIQPKQMWLCLQTSRKNILCDYQGEFNNQNIGNVLKLLKIIYSQSSDYLQRKVYERQIVKLNQTQILILNWVLNSRSKKYSSYLVQWAPLKPKKQYKKVAYCESSDDLASKKVILNAKVKYNYLLTSKESGQPDLKIGKFLFKLRQQPTSKKLYLFRKRQTEQIFHQTPWIAEKTKDGRYLWRGDVKLDKTDVKTLLKFILGKRQKQTAFDCPSILINAGSHGNNAGQNAHDKKDWQYSDLEIKYETVDSLAELVEQNIWKLTLDNIQKTVCIHLINSDVPCIYPSHADHIIDTQCLGAYQKVTADKLNSQIGLEQIDLNFLYPSKPMVHISQIKTSLQKEIQIPKQQIPKLISDVKPPIIAAQYLCMPDSSIILTSQHANKLKNLFGQIKIKKASLLYKASKNNFSVSQYLKSHGSQNHTLLICLTNMNKIIGAYSPLAHLWDSKDKNQQHFGDVRDNTKTSFIFSLNQNDKFTLKDESRAVYRSSDNLSIHFGKNELRIGQQSDLKGNCWANINENYFNANYKNWLDKKSCQRLHGNDTYKFSTKEWQMWKVHIER